MSEEIDRRASGTTRIPFDALVEVGGTLGPAFEAKAVDVSPAGIHLRTTYLPEIGQTISCRFETGGEAELSASGQVVWRREEDHGGEFGVRFDDLDADSSVALKSMAGIDAIPTESRPEKGARVRLHIDGLGYPMRARVKDSQPDEVTIGSNLSFLQLGQAVDLEEPDQGARRSVHIERVSIEIENESCVPQLVVALRYPEPSPIPVHATAPQPEIDAGPSHGSHTSTQRPRGEKSKPSKPSRSGGLQALLAKKTREANPAVKRFAKRLQATAAHLMSRIGHHERSSTTSSFSRTTAPPPEGALHTSGRKVLRGTAMNNDDTADSKFNVRRGTLAVGGAVGIAGILALLAAHKSASVPVAAADPPANNSTVAAPLDPSVVPPATPTPGLPEPAAAPGATVADPLASAITPPSPEPSPGSLIPPPPVNAFPYSSVSPAAPELETAASEKKAPVRRKTPVATSFGNGPVVHANILRLKMDGPITKLQGAAHPTGFTVAIPHRRSLDAAGPLAARDARIASVHVTNDPSGAELSLDFKDGVPRYEVRARGNVLEIALASPNVLPETKSVPSKETASSRNPRTTAKHGDRAKKHNRHPSKKRPR